MATGDEGGGMKNVWGCGAGIEMGAGGCEELRNQTYRFGARVALYVGIDVKAP